MSMSGDDTQEESGCCGEGDQQDAVYHFCRLSTYQFQVSIFKPSE